MKKLTTILTALFFIGCTDNVYLNDPQRLQVLEQRNQAQKLDSINVTLKRIATALEKSKQ